MQMNGILIGELMQSITTMLIKKLGFKIALSTLKKELQFLC